MILYVGPCKAWLHVSYIRLKQMKWQMKFVSPLTSGIAGCHCISLFLFFLCSSFSRRFHIIFFEKHNQRMERTQSDTVPLLNKKKRKEKWKEEYFDVWFWFCFFSFRFFSTEERKKETLWGVCGVIEEPKMDLDGKRFFCPSLNLTKLRSSFSLQLISSSANSDGQLFWSAALVSLDQPLRSVTFFRLSGQLRSSVISVFFLTTFTAEFLCRTCLG